MTINKMAAALLTMMATVAVPAAVAPVAQAEVCGDVGGRHVSVGGCSHVGADIADAAVIGAAVDRPYDAYPVPVGYPPLPPGYLAYPAFPGELPCYTPEGQEYWTPVNVPCY